jgi:nicotinamide riboside kinase
MLPVPNELKYNKDKTKMLKVAFCAGPSSRKSTICAGLESRLKQNKIEADTSREYARQYISVYGLPRDLHEQLTISVNQDTRDQAIAKTSEVLLTDTPPMACYVYSVRMLETIMKERGQTEYTKSQYKFLEEIFIWSLRKTRWFDLIFVPSSPDPVVQDGVRVETDEDRWEINAALTGFLHLNKIPHILIPHNLEGEEVIEFCYKIVLDLLRDVR